MLRVTVLTYANLHSLAYCELYVALAALVLRVFPMMKLYETTAEDVTFHRDVFVSFPKVTSKGVRVVVQE
jgi:hypothetical protein